MASPTKETMGKRKRRDLKLLARRQRKLRRAAKGGTVEVIRSLKAK